MQAKNFLKAIVKNVWFCSLSRYLKLYILVITVWHFIFFRLGLLHTNVDSARYLLSALIQSEAAIVAIVVSLSLVAAQLAASSYSTRVIEVFINYKKNPEPLILLLIYGSAMFWGLAVLKLIEKDNSYLNNQSNLEAYISFSYYLGFFAFIALVPYIKNTLELLKPSVLFNLLAEKITKQNILESIEEKQKEINDNDPILPIVDIVRGALMKYDYETVRDGLRTIRNSVDSIFQNEKIDVKDDEKISKHIFVHLTRLGRLAVSKDDIESTQEVLTTLHKNGMTAVEQRLKYAGQQAAVSLGKIGKAGVKQNLNDVTLKTIDNLTMMGKEATKQELEEVMEQVVFSLEDIGKAAAEQKYEQAIFRVINSLLKIEREAIKQEQDKTTAQVADPLGRCGISRTQQGPKDVTWKIALSLYNIGQETIRQELSDATREVASGIGIIGKAASVDDTDTIREVVKYLEGIANAAAEKRWEDATEMAILSIGEIGIVLAEQELKDAALKTIKILGKIGKTAAIEELENSNLQIEELVEKIDDACSTAK